MLPQRMPALLLAVLFVAVPASALVGAPVTPDADLADDGCASPCASPAPDDAASTAEGRCAPPCVSPAPDDAASTAEGRCAPPCGYINPLIDLDFPEKPACGGGVAIREGRPADCLALPGEPIVLEGTVRWYWEISEDGTYPDDPQTDIVLSFGGTASNPGFLDVSVEPSEFVITSADLVNPTYFKQEQGESGARLWYWYEQPITATIERTGDPTPAELDRLADRDGIQGLFLKAKSNGSSDRFKEAFGVEEFRMDAGPAADANEAPGVPFALLLAGLGAVLLARRR